MPLVKYVANSSYRDGTGALSLGGDRVLKLGGLPLEISDDELTRLSSGKYLLEVIDEEPAKTFDATVASNPDPADKHDPPQDAPPAPPVVAVPASPVIAGSTPGTPTQLPTPSAGN